MTLEYTLMISDLAIADLDIVSSSLVTPTVPLPTGSGWELFQSYASHNKIYYVWVRGSSALTVSTRYLMTGQEGPLLVDASAGPLMITLPTLTSTNRVTVKKIDASVNTVTINTPGVELIDGQATQLISTTYVTLQLVNNGTNWFIV